jgi:hypothetical protein
VTSQASIPVGQVTFTTGPSCLIPVTSGAGPNGHSLSRGTGSGRALIVEDKGTSFAPVVIEIYHRPQLFPRDSTR